MYNQKNRKFANAQITKLQYPKNSYEVDINLCVKSRSTKHTCINLSVLKQYEVHALKMYQKRVLCYLRTNLVSLDYVPGISIWRNKSKTPLSKFI